MRGALSAYERRHVVTCTLTTPNGTLELCLPACASQMRKGWYYQVVNGDDMSASPDTVFMGMCFKIDDRTLSVCGLEWKATGGETWPDAGVVRLDRSPNLRKRKA